ncbi:hypothetical protein NWP16_15955 [Chrysosporum ovalisporum FSS-45]|uniref:hypothetical protein n=1 Tax=Umezakia ovalisporum TaxID=75695 RepID=UPI002476AC2E|nr:hypothetical protein [Umezakia ovalisporum]MDH6079289.1 hypothetical protein [Umezakia ovalisporum FSS-45]
MDLLIIVDWDWSREEARGGGVAKGNSLGFTTALLPTAYSLFSTPYSLLSNY